MIPKTKHAIVLCALLTPAAHAQNIIHVDDDAAPGGDGSSWPAAFQSLDDALAVAKDFDEVWVAGGVYQPNLNGDETSTFTIPNNVRLYGGFKGVETSLGDRPDPLERPSVLEGERAPVGSPGNIDNLITISGNNSAIVDGFKLQNAWAQTSAANINGAAIAIVDSNVTLRNLFFVDCAAVGIGGALGITGDSDVTVTDSTFQDCTATFGGAIGTESNTIVDRCEFTGNASVDLGGAIYTSGQGVRVVQDSSFDSNRGTDGGGAIAAELLRIDTTTAMIVGGCDFTANQTTGTGSDGGAILLRFDGEHEIRDCRFLGNSTADDGGAIACFATAANSSRVENCLISGNIAGNRGAGIFDGAAGDLTLVNATVMGNNSGGLGAGMYTHAGDVVTANTILWDNDNINSGGQPLPDQFGLTGGQVRTLSLNHTIMQSWGPIPAITDTNTFGTDPQFVDATGTDGIYGTSDDNPRLSSGSIAIDAGHNLYLSASISTDINGNARYLDDTGTVDKGVGDGVNPVVDIGAAEFTGTSGCAADCDLNGILNVDDVDCFVAAFLGGALSEADCDGNGMLNVDDVDCFVAAFLGGCS